MLNSDIEKIRKTGGWYAIQFGTIKKNGAYTAIVPFIDAYNIIKTVTVARCVVYNNWEQKDITCTTYLSVYSRNSIIIQTTDEYALGLGGNIGLEFEYN